jgi:integrase
MRRRALAAAGLKDLQFRDVRKAAVNEAKKLGSDAQEFAGHSDPRTTEKHYLNEPVVVKPIR